MIHSSSDPLAGLDEAGFRTRILIPLLSEMGYRDVDHTHGPAELGKDIVARDAASSQTRYPQWRSMKSFMANRSPNRKVRFEQIASNAPAPQ